MSMHDQIRLDAAESAFFKRQLEFIDRTVYEHVYPENKARRLIPTQAGVPDWAKVYTWRLFEKFGNAKIVANMADDIPRADVAGTEESKVIKPIASSYGWDVFEIKAAAATGTALDSLKAMSARLAIETELDRILALGDTTHGLDGLLALGDVTPANVAVKAYGDTEWTTDATPDSSPTDRRSRCGCRMARSWSGPASRRSNSGRAHLALCVQDCPWDGETIFGGATA